MTLFVREHNHRRRVPFVASPPDSGAEAERLRRAFVEVAKHAELVMAAASAGAISAEVALQEIRRHARTLVAAVKNLGEP